MSKKGKRKPPLGWGKIWKDFFAWNKKRRTSSTNSLDCQMRKIEELVERERKAEDVYESPELLGKGE